MPTKTKGVRYWTKKLDAEFSKYIRQKYMDDNGEVECYTCFKREHYKRMHAGHFVSRNARATRWDETNVRPQCPACNTFNEGMGWVFGNRLDEEYGEGTAENLEAQRFSIVKRSPAELQTTFEYYRDLNSS